MNEESDSRGLAVRSWPKQRRANQHYASASGTPHNNHDVWKNMGMKRLPEIIWG